MNIEWVYFGFLAYQPLLVIYRQIMFNIYIKYMICKHILQIHTVKTVLFLTILSSISQQS